MSTLATIIQGIDEGMKMMNHTKQEKDCQQFWEETLYVPIILPTQLDIATIRQQIPIPFAEREDTLTLMLNGDSEKTIQMHTEAWMRSLDYLLYRYLTLVLHDPHYSATIRVPVEIRQKYQQYRLQWKKRQHKDSEFIVPDYYINPHPGRTDSTEEGAKYEYFKTDNPVASAILNVFCHGLFPHAGNKEVRWNPHVNAQLYKLDKCGDKTIPKFKTEDYIAYELMTGLSLSVEITAILLEIDQEIRDLAFHYFCEYALADLVRIPFPYARSAAARNFFLQVNLDWSREKYKWSPASSRELTKQIIKSAALGALAHIQTLSSSPLHPQEPPRYPYSIVYEQGADLTAILRQLENDKDLKHVATELRKTENDPTTPTRYIIYPSSKKPGEFNIESYMFPYYPIFFPLTDDIEKIESYKKQIKTNLKSVLSPLDCESLLDSTPNSLAVFTNPKHKFIPMLLKYVETGERNTRSMRNPPPVKTDECFDLFHLVFYTVRHASIEAHQDIYRVKRFLKQM